MKKALLPLLFWTLAAAAVEEAPPGQALDGALAAAKARHAAVFIDFSAVWCHSCYYMDREVLTGPEWKSVEKRAVTLELDADSPDGTAAAQKYKIGGYPTYVVLDENGAELGRILGDRPRAEFYGLLEPILAKGAALEKWQAQVKDGSAPSVAAGRIALEALYERFDAKASLDWFTSLPAAAQSALKADATSADLVARIELFAASDRNDVPACDKAAARVLATVDCGRLMELSSFQGCYAKEKPEAQKAALAPYKPKMEALQDAVLVKGFGVCSDTRGIVETAVELYEGLEDKAAHDTVLAQGVAYSERKLKGKYRSDRGLADNLRFYRELQKNDAALDALYPKLIKAYPDDYVYAYRWGKSLAKRGKFKQALPLLERSAGKSFGRNRLWVAQWRTYVLMKLSRAGEGQKIASEALAASGPFFEKDAAELEAIAGGKAPA